MYTESPLTLWLTMAEGGDATAQAYVGEIFERGVGVPPDYKKAAYWYERAAKGGSSSAANALGALYEKGLGVPKDAAQALAWYGRAAGSDGRIDIAAPAIAKPDTNEGPEIVLIKPPEFLVATRDIVVTPNSKTVRVSSRETDLTIEGRVVASAGVSSFTINGRETKLNANLFETQLPIRRAEEPVHMVAVDRAGRKNTLDFVILRREDTAPSSDTPDQVGRPLALRDRAALRSAFGSYHALVIGNDEYPKMTQLRTAVNDAKAVADVLQRDYGFTVTLLIDAGRATILNALEKLRMQLTEKDNLLIYYAGHGWQEPITKRGYWVPVDAEETSRANMISNVDIGDVVATMKVKQLLVVADSCFSGVLIGHTRAAPLAGSVEELDRIRELAKKNSRMVMTSASLEPAIDGNGSHSIFAGPFIQLLLGNAGVLAGQEMFARIYPKVVLAATRINMSQTPEYGALTANGGDDKAGHQGGDFFFVKAR